MNIWYVDLFCICNIHCSSKIPLLQNKIYMKTDGDGVGVGGDFYVISVDFYEIDDKLMNI